MKSNYALFNFPKRFQSLVRRSVRETLAREKVKISGEINLILVPDSQIKRLNRKYRKVRRITDVISFCYGSAPVEGDVFIARERSVKQAKQQRHQWQKELSYLAIHGILHLLGYTDYTKTSRTKMFSVQNRIWQCLFS